MSKASNNPKKVPTLKKRAEFLSVREKGKSEAAASLVLQYCEKDESVRVGYTVSGKVGNAVERNRIKRRLRAAFSAISAEGTLKNGDYVLIGRRASLKVSFQKLLNDFRKLVKRLQ